MSLTRYVFYESCKMLSRTSSVSSSQSAYLVWEYVHEVDEASDLEDFHIVVAQTTGEQAAASFACSGQQANNQRNSCTIDVIHITEVEQDDIRILVFSFSVGCIKPLLCKGVNFAVQIHDS